MIKIKFCVLVIGIIYSTSINAQSKIVLENYSPKRDLVFETKSMIYYGLDFSKVRLIDSKEYGKDAELKNFIPQWLKFANDELKPEDQIRRWLNFDEDKFTFYPKSVQSRFELVPDKWIEMFDYSFNIDTVKSMVKSYKLDQKNGIAFVIILECFVKETESVTAYFTFFDTESREVLWATKVKGGASKGSMISYWGATIISATKRYIDEVYAYQKKLYNKLNENN